MRNTPERPGAVTGVRATRPSPKSEPDGGLHFVREGERKPQKPGQYQLYKPSLTVGRRSY